MSLWRSESPLILASQSSARKMLLANAGLEFKAITADIDERGIQAASKLSNPREIALLLAREKAKAVSAHLEYSERDSSLGEADGLRLCRRTHFSGLTPFFTKP